MESATLLFVTVVFQFSYLIYISLKICYVGHSENFGSIRESCLECMQGVVLCMKRLHFISWNWCKEKSTVAQARYLEFVLIRGMHYSKQLRMPINSPSVETSCHI